VIDSERSRRYREAAKKAWRTRRRQAKPSKVMRRWLAYLMHPNACVVARYRSNLGTLFSFGSYPPPTLERMYHTPSWPPHFARGTFFALFKRRWVERVHRTAERQCGHSYDSRTGARVDHYGHETYYQITDRGRRALAAAEGGGR
jgi:hypothetical protein